MPPKGSHLSRYCFLALGLLLLLAACNRPAEEPPPNRLATSVAATIAAQPTLPPTEVPLVESATTVPEEGTPVPTQETQESPTEGLPEESPTSSPIPLEPGDPRSGLNLSNPDYVDDFSQPFTWFEFSDPEAASVTSDDGRLRVTDHIADGILWWTTTALEASDVYAEVIVQPSACSGRDAYGMALRVGGANIDRGYTLEVACSGEWRMRKFIAFDEIPDVLKDWADSEAIETGPDATNLLGLLVRGSQIHAFVNGILLDSDPIEDDDYASGVPSLFTNAARTADLSAHFDDFKLWRFPP